MTYKIISGFIVSVAIAAGIWMNRSKPQVAEVQLPSAFEEFDKDNTTIYIDGKNVVIESNGMPNHTSPYWSNITERSAVDPRGRTLKTRAAAENHPLFVEPTHRYKLQDHGPREHR